jgi:hypothetical protein
MIICSGSHMKMVFHKVINQKNVFLVVNANNHSGSRPLQFCYHIFDNNRRSTAKAPLPPA